MNLPASSSQALVVSAESPSSTSARMTLYEREGKSGAWHPTGASIDVVIGRSGLASVRKADARWGMPEKCEGDGATPVGTFPLETAFGRAATFPSRLPYLALTRSTEAVDDPASRFYNRIVDRQQVGSPDWKSAEQMFRDDELYDLGVVVGYNTTPARPGKGSCIFLHIWRSPRSPTSGCVAMSRRDLERVVRWLDPGKHPVIAIRISRKNAGCASPG